MLFSHLAVQLIDKCDAFLELLSPCFVNVPWFDGTLGLDPGCKSLNASGLMEHKIVALAASPWSECP